MRAGRQRWIVPIALLAVTTLAPGAAAQDARDETPRDRLRQRYDSARSRSNLDDAIRKIRSDEPDTRLEGARSLGASRDPKVIEHLIGATADTDLRVKIKAIDELGNMRAAEATPVLIQLLFLRDTETALQQRVLAALGKIGDRRATAPVAEFLSRDLDPAIRGTAIFALGEIGDPAGLDALARLAATAGDPDTQRLADEATRKIKHRAPPPVVIPALAEGGAR
jgi:HEAT repeat protein